MHKRFLCLIALISIFSSHLVLAQAPTAEQALQYTPPVRQEFELRYPLTAQKRQLEGWIDLDFMVATDGTVFAAKVVDSSGSHLFEKAAMRGLTNAVYRPAKEGDTPIEARSEIRARFELSSPEKGASSSFVRRYRAISTALEKNDVEKASEQLAALEKLQLKNLYEDAFLNIAKFRVAAASDATPAQLLLFLSRALNGDGQEKYLPADMYTNMLATLLSLKINYRDYRGAQQAFAKLNEVAGGEEYRSMMADKMAKIDAFKSQEGAYDIAAKIEEGGWWRLPLFKNRFYFDAVQGSLREVKLTCSKRYVVIEYLAESDYVIPESYGNCYASVYGEPGTTFKFWQF